MSTTQPVLIEIRKSLCLLGEDVRGFAYSVELLSYIEANIVAEFFAEIPVVTQCVHLTDEEPAGANFLEYIDSQQRQVGKDARCPLAQLDDVALVAVLRDRIACIGDDGYGIS